MLRKINNNAYQVQLPAYFKISNVFNIRHLVPYSVAAATCNTAAFDFGTIPLADSSTAMTSSTIPT